MLGCGTCNINFSGGLRQLIPMFSYSSYCLKDGVLDDVYYDGDMISTLEGYYLNVLMILNSLVLLKYLSTILTIFQCSSLGFA